MIPKAVREDAARRCQLKRQIREWWDYRDLEFGVSALDSLSTDALESLLRRFKEMPAPPFLNALKAVQD